MAHADEVLTDLDAIAEKVNPVTYAVVASHGHFDQQALERVLRARAPYVGLVASRERARPILEHLRRRGFGDDDLARVEAPAGLDIGARRGDEIALSIMAAIVQRRRAAEGVAWPAPEPAADEPDTEPTAAIDPICGMSVPTRDARFTHEHAGTVFYFCCAGCKSTFAADPEPHLAGEARSRLAPEAAPPTSAR